MFKTALLVFSLLASQACFAGDPVCGSGYKGYFTMYIANFSSSNKRYIEYCQLYQGNNIEHTWYPDKKIKSNSYYEITFKTYSSNPNKVICYVANSSLSIIDQFTLDMDRDRSCSNGSASASNYMGSDTVMASQDIYTYDDSGSDKGYFYAVFGIYDYTYYTEGYLNYTFTWDNISQYSPTQGMAIANELTARLRNTVFTTVSDSNVSTKFSDDTLNITFSGIAAGLFNEETGTDFDNDYIYNYGTAFYAATGEYPSSDYMKGWSSTTTYTDFAGGYSEDGTAMSSNGSKTCDDNNDGSGDCD